jgi:hypothetical protein
VHRTLTQWNYNRYPSEDFKNLPKEDLNGTNRFKVGNNCASQVIFPQKTISESGFRGQDISGQESGRILPKTGSKARDEACKRDKKRYPRDPEPLPDIPEHNW